jgi:hypothetical protein
MSDETSTSSDGRRPYVTPEVRKDHLRPEEAVLGNCKHGSANGPGNATCSTGGSCFTLGS